MINERKFKYIFYIWCAIISEFCALLNFGSNKIDLKKENKSKIEKDI